MYCKTENTNTRTETIFFIYRKFCNGCAIYKKTNYETNIISYLTTLISYQYLVKFLYFTRDFRTKLK